MNQDEIATVDGMSPEYRAAETIIDSSTSYSDLLLFNKIRQDNSGISLEEIVERFKSAKATMGAEETEAAEENKAAQETEDVEKNRVLSRRVKHVKEKVMGWVRGLGERERSLVQKVLGTGEEEAESEQGEGSKKAGPK